MKRRKFLVGAASALAVPAIIGKATARAINPGTLTSKGAGGALTPASISGLAAWWDFSDGSTVTLNGSDVSSCANKVSGGTALAQSTEADQPPYNTGDATLNGLAHAEWTSNASDEHLEATSYAGIQIADTLTVAFSFNGGGGEAWWDMLDKGVNTGAGIGYTFQQENLTEILRLRIDTSGAANQTFQITTALDDNDHHVIARFSSGALNVRMNGVERIDTTYTHGAGLSSTDVLRLGDPAVENVVKIGELAIYNRSLSDSDTLSLESYLGRWV